MKKIILAVFLSTSAFMVRAQLQRPKPSFEFSGGIQVYKFSGVFVDPQFGLPTSINVLNPIFNFTGSFNIPLKEMKDDLYFGVNPNISLGYTFGTFAGDLPVYVTLKYGAGSNRDSQAKFGVGIGGGAFFSAISTTLVTDIYGNPLRYSALYVAPAIMAEISAQIDGRGLFQIRTDFTPIPVEKTGEFTGNISQYNLKVIKMF